MAQRPAPVPDLDWDSARARELGGELVEIWTELLARMPELPVGREFRADEVRERIVPAVPGEGMTNAELVAYLRELVFENSIYPGHPGFSAYVSGAGTVPGAGADLIASALNQNLGGFRLSPGPNQIETALIAWLASRFGLPDGAGGQVVAGGAMANFVGLKLARDAALGAEARTRGLAAGPPLALLHLERGAHRAGARGRHARDGHRRRPGNPGGRRAAHARRRARRCARARPRRGRRACCGDRHGRDDEHRRDRPAATRSRTAVTGTPRVPRGCLLRRSGRAGGGPSAAARGGRARRLDRRRCAQVAVHPAARRLRPRPGGRAAAGVVRGGHERHLAGRGDARDPRQRTTCTTVPTSAVASRRCASGCRSWPTARRLRAAHLARRQARSLPRRARGGARRLRADDAGEALDLLLPLRARRATRRRRGARPAERADHGRDPGGRPRLLLERRARRALRPARLHRQLPHRGGAHGASARRGGGARPAPWRGDDAVHGRGALHPGRRRRDLPASARGGAVLAGGPALPRQLGAGGPARRLSADGVRRRRAAPGVDRRAGASSPTSRSCRSRARQRPRSS